MCTRAKAQGACKMNMSLKELLAMPDNDNEERLGYLRERVSALEAVIGIHQEMLKEMRDAVLGINTSLRVLTSLEERMIAVQESSADNKSRLAKVEQDIGALKETNGVNTNGRRFAEAGVVAVLAGVSGALAAFFARVISVA